MTHKNNYLNYIAALIWTIGACVFYFNNGNMDYWVYYLLCSIAPAFLFFSIVKNLCLDSFRLKQHCDKTNYQIGMVSLAIVLNLVQVFFLKLGLNKDYIVNQYYFVAFFLFNPFVIYYALYFYLAKIMKLSNN